MTLELIRGFLEGITPTERILPSEWADKYRFLSSSASAEPGRWSTDRTPYLREVMDAFSPHNEAKEIICIKGAQLGFTELGFNVVGFHIDIDPCPIMYVMPTLETIKRNSKMRISPMIASTPVLAQKIKASRKKDSGNSMFQKDFPGGTLILAGGNSAASLRSVPIKVLVLDEVDGYPLDLENEGSPIDLAKARTRTFPKKKIFYLSTPLVHGTSVIEAKFLETSQRRYHVPCPYCKTMQHLQFSQLKYTKSDDGKRAENVKYECEKCKKLISEHSKTKMLANGEWRDSFPDLADPEKLGYHINSLYSPLGWYSWEDACTDWILAQKKPDKLKVFVNTVLGETWMEKGEVPDWEMLLGRKSSYQINQPPKEVCLITAGIDVQKDRLEMEIVGWTKGKTSYSIDYRIIPGDTANLEVWDDLAAMLNERWTREDGLSMPIYIAGIDTGYNTNMAYTFCRRPHSIRVVPVKGQDTLMVPVSQPRAVDLRKRRKKNKHSLAGLVLYHVGTSLLKQELYGWLKQHIGDEGVPSGYCFFPENYDAHYFKMLTAEKLTKQLVKGYSKYVWLKIRERNEALDCRVYARAAASIVGIDRWSDEDWEAVAGSYVETKKRKRKPKSDFW